MQKQNGLRGIKETREAAVGLLIGAEAREAAWVLKVIEASETRIAERTF
jgi:hypothetical protein